MSPLQMGTVSRAFAEAARTVFSMEGNLHLTDLHAKSHPTMSLSTGLMLRFAPLTTSMCLHSTACSLQGLSAYLAAAPGLTDMRMSCETIAAGREADMLLSHCKAIRVLVLEGKHLPYILPESVQKLQVDDHGGSDRWSDTASEAEAEYIKDCNHAFLCRLTRLTQLQVLNMNLQGTSSLDSSVRLPTLSKLVVHVCVIRLLVDLPWLKVQPYEELELHISDTSGCMSDPVGAHAHHARLVSELQQLRITKLDLQLQRTLQAGVARSWAA